MKEITYTVKVDADGNKFWYVNGKCHRVDGPAIEWANGDNFWFVNGVELTEKEFNESTKKPCTDKTITIDGKNYKLVAV